MIRHHYTLAHVCREIALHTGAIITGCFSQESNSLILALQTGRTETYIECNTDPVYASITMRPAYSRARRNVHPYFPELTGTLLNEVEISPYDRVIRLHFSGNLTLEAQIFGGAKSDVVLINRTGNLFVSSFTQRGGQYTDYTPKNWLEFPPETMVAAALSRSSFLLGEHYAAEVCYRCEVPPQTPLVALTDAAREQLNTQAEELREECIESPLCYILREQDETRPVFSLVPLRKFPVVEWRGVSASEGVGRVIGLRRREKRLDDVRGRLSGTLSKELHKLTRAVEMMANEAISDERARQRRMWAEVLLAQPNPTLRSGNEITLTDWSGEPAVIPLDPTRNLAENAEVFFNKARSAERRSAIRKERLPKFRARIAEIEQELARLRAAKTAEEVETMSEEALENSGNTRGKEQSKYRKFDLEEGFTAYVGKNAANNDELTMRFAKPNDYWFHARGVSGSHVVLRGGQPVKSKPPKRVIEQTASIAAYYSQSRNGGFVPVAYTQKKYIRKPKGANPGAVVLEREEVVMVQPKLPFGQDNDAL